jgi:hypothetical protein
MSGKSAEIANLYMSKPYEAQTASVLADYVAEQSASGTYDFEANKALLKIYQCVPDLANLDVIVKLLALSLMRLPRTDFLALWFMLPGKAAINAKDPKLKLVGRCGELLQSGKFAQFWEEYKESPLSGEIFGATGFEKAIRVFMVENIRNVYANINKQGLQEMLGFGSAANEFQTFCENNRSIGAVSDSIEFVSCPENCKGPAKKEKSLGFEEMLRLVDSIKGQ